MIRCLLKRKHSRVACAEIHDDETAITAIGVLRRAVAWFAARGVRTERVLTHNGSAYKSHASRDACLRCPAFLG